MKYTVYAISSIAKNYIYVGFTKELETRFDRHNIGLNKTTAPYAPFQLLLTELVGSDREEARVREKYWKSGTGKRKLRILRDELG